MAGSNNIGGFITCKSVVPCSAGYVLNIADSASAGGSTSIKVNIYISCICRIIQYINSAAAINYSGNVSTISKGKYVFAHTAGQIFDIAESTAVKQSVIRFCNVPGIGSIVTSKSVCTTTSVNSSGNISTISKGKYIITHTTDQIFNS